MVKYFHFKDHEREPYVAQLQSQQCQGITLRNVRCTKRCLIGTSKCWIHLISEHHLRIKPATDPIMGSGLYAFNENANGYPIFRNRDYIIDYDGENIDLNTLNERYGDDCTAPYAVKKRQNVRYIDCATTRCVGSLINHDNNSNCEFYNSGQLMKIRATRNIYHNQELFINYGSEFLLDEPNCLSTTSNKRYMY